MPKVMKNGFEIAGTANTNSKQMKYDNSDSTLESTNVKEAIDELDTNVNTKLTANGGDTKSNKTTFTSDDSTSSTAWTDVSALTSGLTHANLFNRISTMFKNMRWLYKMLGTTDISTLSTDGTVTGALSALNTDIQDYLAIKNFKYTRVITSTDWNATEQPTLPIPTDCKCVRLRFWYSGTSEPCAGQMHFYRNMPKVKSDTMYYYDGTNKLALCTATVDWENGTVTCSNISIPLQYWYVGVQCWE